MSRQRRRGGRSIEEESDTCVLDYVGRVCATNDKARDLAEENRGEEGEGSKSSRSRGTKDVAVCDSQKFIKLNRHTERKRQ